MTDRHEIEADTYTCAACHEEFETDWTDWSPEQILKEGAESFPGVPLEDMAIICDDCWKKFYSVQ